MGSRLLPPTELPYPTFIEKETIQNLPVFHYNGFIHLVSDPLEAERVCELIGRETILGFDTETRPTFRKGQSFLPSLIQIATSDAVYLFQLTHMAIPEGLKTIFGNASIIKAGAALDFDVKKLQELAPFIAKGFVDLATIAARLHIKNRGLRTLAALLLGIKISKKAQCSNWAKKSLDQTQLLYAATDAWISRELYLHLKKIEQTLGIP